MNELIKARMLSLPMADAISYWDMVIRAAKERDALDEVNTHYIMVVRDLCLNDLFYLLVRVSLYHSAKSFLSVPPSISCF